VKRWSLGPRRAGRRRAGRLAATVALLAIASACTESSTLAGDAELELWSIGRSDHTVVVAVHGGPGVTHDYLRPEWDRYADFGELVYYDQRGCGESGPTASHDWRDHVGDLGRVVEAVAEGRRVVLAGSSWGTALIHLYLREHPQGADAVIVSGFGLDRIPRQVRERIRSFPDRPRMDSLAGMIRLRDGVLLRGRSAVPGEIDARLTLCDDVNREVQRSLRGVPPVEDPTDLPVPGLLFVDSARESPVEVAGVGVEIVHLPSHDPWFTHRELYFERVESFLSELGSRGSSPRLLPGPVRRP